MEILWSDNAWDDLIYWFKQDRKTANRIFKLIKDIDRNGHVGIGKPEPLKGDLTSYWSRRIDNCNRLVYKINKNVIQIVQCRTHYGDE